jgi:aminocarboxymuconate-semialdehyde decarboxylase
MVPEHFPASPGSAELPWPTMRHRSCQADVLISGKVYRTVADTCWAVPKRVAAMEESGVTIQVVSPMPELLSYWLPAKEAAVLCAHLNDEIARMVAEGAGRFMGLGAVTLQDPDAAAPQLEAIMRTPELRGVEIGTHANGKPIGDPFFEPFFTAAEALGAAVFVHPLRPAGMERLIGPPALEQVVAFPCETSLAIASVMTGGMLERRTKLKLAFSHGGGAFGLVLPRLQHGWAVLPALQAQMPQSPATYARRLSFDTLVYDQRTLRFLVDQFGADRMMAGSDFPFAIAEREPGRFVRTLGLDEEAAQAIAWKNAERFFARS